MDWVYEIACAGDADHASDAHAWLDAAIPIWNALPGLSALDLYRPIDGGAHDPFNDDGPGPLFIVMLAFPSREALGQAIMRAEFGRSLGARPPGLDFTGSGFERHFYPVAGETIAAPLTAPFSYVVRYHRPAQDEAAFIRNYVDTHPPTLRTLPGIRSVMCYFPQDMGTPALAAADTMIGNEAAFDDVAAFNAAMQSPVRQELRRHFREFPPFTGRNTHFPMNRARLAG
jgi:hypothetical protein